MNNTELKPCPFCGSEVKIFPEQVDARTVSYNFICVECCSNTYFDYADREEAIESWNTRKPMDNIVAELEKAKGGLPITEEDWNYCGAIDEAIDIVRKGGVE